MQQRRLTISRHYPERRATRSRSLTVPMPFLRLQGRWLDEAGFAIGSNVQIAVSRGRLVVEVIESASRQEKR